MSVGIYNVLDVQFVLLGHLDDAAAICRRIDNQSFAAFRITHDVGEYRHVADLHLL